MQRMSFILCLYPISLNIGTIGQCSGKVLYWHEHEPKLWCPIPIDYRVISKGNKSQIFPNYIACFCFLYPFKFILPYRALNELKKKFSLGFINESIAIFNFYVNTFVNEHFCQLFCTINQRIKFRENVKILIHQNHAYIFNI